MSAGEKPLPFKLCRARSTESLSSRFPKRYMSMLLFRGSVVLPNRNDREQFREDDVEANHSRERRNGDRDLDPRWRIFAPSRWKATKTQGGNNNQKTFQPHAD